MNQFDQLCQIAEANREAGNWQEALKIVSDLVCKFPEQPYPVYMLGMRAVEEGQDHLALPLLQQAVSKNPENPYYWGNLGGVLRRQEHRREAIHCYQEALKIEPNNQLALTGMAGCHVNSGKPEDGIGWALKAMAAEGPHTIHARNSLALMLLEKGDWKTGFKEYQGREDLPNFHRRDFGDIPRFDGKTKVDCLAICAEQGLGDEILFTSCLEDAMKFATHLAVECNFQVLPLLQRSFPSVAFYPTHEELMAREKPDAWERMGDLPRHFRPAPSACPGTPYITADPAAVRGWRARLEASGPPPYIGYAWLGGTAMTHRNDRRAPRDRWAKLIAGAPGTKVSLQYGEDGKRQAEKMDLHHWQAAIDNIDETANLIAALDLVVSSPQTVIHLAGGLGKPCIVALSSKPAWRYGIKGPMPWYKSVQLVRQKGEEWDQVFARIEEMIHADYARAQAA